MNYFSHCTTQLACAEPRTDPWNRVQLHELRAVAELELNVVVQQDRCGEVHGTALHRSARNPIDGHDCTRAMSIAVSPWAIAPSASSLISANFAWSFWFCCE